MGPSVCSSCVSSQFLAHPQLLTGVGGNKEEKRKSLQCSAGCCSAAAKHQLVLIMDPNQHCMKKFDSITERHSALSVGIRQEGQKRMFPLPCVERGFPHWNRSDLLFALSLLSLFTSYTLFLDYSMPGCH